MLASGDRPNDAKGLAPGDHIVRDGRVGGLEGQILPAGEEAQHGAPFFRCVIPNRPTQHGISGLQGIQDRPLGDRPLDLEADLFSNASQVAQVVRQDNPDHGNVWTSTERTAGRSRTIGAQLSPASAEAYTWPPVVPK